MAVVALLSGTIDVRADVVSVPFLEGFIGVTGSNTGQANNILTSQTLGIDRFVFSQNSSSNSFEIQGNDIPGTLEIITGAGRFSIPGAIVWRWQNSSPYSLGFIPASSVNLEISYGINQKITVTGGGLLEPRILV